MQKHMQNVMAKEVSRKEFLSLSALTIASVMGFGTIIKLLTGYSLSSHKSVTMGYGSSPYGGGHS